MNGGSTALIGLSYSMFGAVLDQISSAPLTRMRSSRCAAVTHTAHPRRRRPSPSPRSTDSTLSPSPLRQRRLGRSTRTTLAGVIGIIIPLSKRALRSYGRGNFTSMLDVRRRDDWPPWNVDGL